ncbi:MAG TPA: DegT/DnrJ/EryC1/StrS family aminotransferase, partial [Bacteroidota bacterium]|nr:DegT/DnrJ/EryC1/StrS family aminotransferase [Bacteroidota bacterium]
DVGDLCLPFERPNGCHVYHLFVISTHRRDALQAHLAKNGISAGLHYPIPLHLQPAYSNIGYAVGDFPASEAAARECLSLPLYAEMNAGQVERVISAVREFYR